MEKSLCLFSILLFPSFQVHTCIFSPAFHSAIIQCIQCHTPITPPLSILRNLWRYVKGSGKPQCVIVQDFFHRLSYSLNESSILSWGSITGFDSNIYSLSQNCQKRLLASSYLSVCLSAWKNSAPIGRIFVEFDIEIFFENQLRKLKFQ